MISQQSPREECSATCALVYVAFVDLAVEPAVALFVDV